MDSKQLSSIFDLSNPSMVQLLVDLASQVVLRRANCSHLCGPAPCQLPPPVLRRANCSHLSPPRPAAVAAGSKFTGQLRVGSLEDFYQGVT